MHGHQPWRGFYPSRIGNVGVHDEQAAKRVLRESYSTVIDARYSETSIENAEMIKGRIPIRYRMIDENECENAFLANTGMEICNKISGERTPLRELPAALARARTRRFSAMMYLKGGHMGRRRRLHPARTISTLSWLARERYLSYDLFEADHDCARDIKTQSLACRVDGILPTQLAKHARSKVIIGKSFKADDQITVGVLPLLPRRNCAGKETGH